MTESRRVPSVVFVVALAMAVLHMVPTWIAMNQVPTSEWVFTGNRYGSPDYMQYYSWARRTQVTGVFVDNTFTSEPNTPHLLMLPYFVVGTVARWLHVAPEFAHQYLGALYASGFTILLFLLTRVFVPVRAQTWWIFGAMFGGGLSGHLQYLPWFRIAYTPLLARTVTYAEAVGDWFEDFRGFLIIKTLFDAHFLLIMLLMVAAVLALYHALQRFSVVRLGLSMSAFAALTLVHLYEGVTVSAIAVSALFFCWCKGLLRRDMFLTAGASAGVAAACIGLQVVIFRAGGLPLPEWREPDILVSSVALAFPWAWGLLAWGWCDYWNRAGLKECFLIGWLVACLAMIFSGPFYPYSTRGAHSLQIPATIIAGTIFFHHWKRVTLVSAVLIVGLLGATTSWELGAQWRLAHRVENQPWVFMDPGRQQVVRYLSENARQDDILLAKTSDRLWLVPRYPGRLYCGHFFLTVDFERKCTEMEAFYEQPATHLGLPDRSGARFLYVDSAEEPRRFTGVPGLEVRVAVPAGTLFEYVTR